MALGKRKDSGNFLPIIKFDARVGTFYLQDRVNTDGNWQTEQRDVTEGFRAAFDLENLQRGWIRFPKGAAPEVTLVPAGEDPGESPSDEHREGIRVILVMAKNPGGGVRELMSTARGLWNAIDTLHDQYLASAAKHAGELPIVTLDDVREVKTGGGTTFVPVFKIVDWTPRPPELAGVSQAQFALPLATKPTADVMRSSRRLPVSPAAFKTDPDFSVKP